MSSSTLNDRIIFGLQIKQKRQALKMSFAELSKASGLSISYLNEIEKGKKHPKPAKLNALMNALNLKVEDLNSKQLSHNFSAVNELLRSNFLHELPLDFFGIEVAKVAEIITNAPTKVSAFIATLLEISRNHALNKENFYFSALRSYLQLNYNFFSRLEQAVEQFKQQHGIQNKQLIHVDELAQILTESYDYQINKEALDQHPELNSLKSLYIPSSKVLLLSKQLNPIQESFQLGKELGFNVLKLKERANTSSLMQGGSFTEVHNHSQAIYFSVALHLPLKDFVNSVQRFFALEQWDPEVFESIRATYRATPEMFYHRLTNILPEFFGIKKLFFLRFKHNKQKDWFEVDRELHLDMRHQPHGNSIQEHYCRRWITISSLKDLIPKKNEEKILVSAQRSKFWDTQDEYLCITIGWNIPTSDYNVSVTIGLLINDNLKKQVNFINDPAIPQVVVNKTCERCDILDCKDRAAPPTVLQEKIKIANIKKSIESLNQKYG